MNKNKVVSMLMAAFFLFGIPSYSAMAQDDIKVVLNGEELVFDAEPQMMNDRVMVPMRKIFEALGAEVEWHSQTQTISATSNDVSILMQIDNPDISISGKRITLDVPPRLVGDRTLVPVRAVAEGLDAEVEWNNEEQTVLITKAEKPDQSYSAVSAPGFPHLLSANNGQWTIAIPEEYEEMLAEDGNNIYKKADLPEMIYVQIRDISKTNLSLKEIAEKTKEERAVTLDSGLTYSVEKDVSEETINGLDYYYFKLNATMKGSDLKTYTYCYFVVWEDQLFEFTCSTVSETMLPEFTAVLESFHPKKDQ